MKTVSELKAEIKKGLKLTTLEEVNAQIEYIYSLEETYAHEKLIDGKLMEELLYLQIDLETDIA